MSRRKAVQAVQIYGADELKAVMKEFTAENGDMVKAMRSAVTRAVNKQVKPYLYDIAKKEYTAGEDDLKDTSKISSSKTDTEYGRAVRLRANRIQLSKYYVTPTNPPMQKGIPVKSRIPGPVVAVRQGEVPKLMKGVIVAKMESGHIGLFERLPGTKAKPKTLPNGKTVQREKIRELISLSMTEMIRKGMKVPDENKMGIAAIRKNITEQIRKNVISAQKRYKAKMAGGNAV